jgi:hypothetical protein
MELPALFLEHQISHSSSSTGSSAWAIKMVSIYSNIQN